MIRNKKGWLRIAESSFRKRPWRKEQSLLSNKKGWLRIAEAFIAILLISVIFSAVYSQQKIKKSNINILTIEDGLLNEIANNKQLREEIIKNEAGNATRFVGERVSGLNFAIKICEVEDICTLNSYVPEVYARERIISSTLIQYSPKKIKLFMWEKS